MKSPDVSAMEPTDETLMYACQAGSSTALGDLVGRYSTMLFGYLVRMCGSREDAQDVFQDTFLRVHTRASTFRQGAVFKPWLFAIATNAAYDCLRRRQRTAGTILWGDLDDATARAVEPVAPADTADPPCILIRDEQKQQVQKAIGTLPLQQRTALVLAYYQDLPYREVAEVMGCSIGTVKTHMSRALHSLAHSLASLRMPCKEAV